MRTRFLGALLALLLLMPLGVAAAPAGSAASGPAGSAPYAAAVAEPTAADAPITDPVEVLLPATVVYVVEEQQLELLGEAQRIQRLELRLTTGQRRGEVITALTAASPVEGGVTYGVGDRVYVRQVGGSGDGAQWEVASRDRSVSLGILALLFVVVVLAVAQMHGVRALLALGLSFVIILAYVVPRVAAGATPVASALIGCGLTMPLSYYLSHGLRRKTTVALAGSLAGLLFTGLLAEGAISLVGLTGISGDETAFVSAIYGASINLRALLMAGMIIGVLGVLDDVSVAQAATVEQIASANPALRRRELFIRGMAVGKDHISSMVNTLMLVYAGTSLGLLLLLTDQSLPLGYVLSQELVAEELVRMLVTSTGLVLTVPITTGLAAALLLGRRRGTSEPNLPEGDDHGAALAEADWWPSTAAPGGALSDSLADGEAEASAERDNGATPAAHDA
ncbi:MAG: YibE/F family protein [Anaerolineae bacterium]|jgi:uncharacterized membrane protein|nr:YibE/F family protein [Chloroflexota bacterium]